MNYDEPAPFNGHTLRCRVFGCERMAGADVCERCNADGYRDGLATGLLRTVYFAFSRVRRFVWPRCDSCKRHMWPWRTFKGFEWCCSQECADDWMPF